MSLEFKHVPVMSVDVDRALTPYKSGIYIDCTFGGGGITRKILSKKNTKVISIDRDNFVESFSKQIKKDHKGRFEFVIDKFSNLEKILKERHLEKVPVAIIFDLGLSSFQIDNPDRGFSYRHDGLLKMTMGKNNISAHDIVNKLDQKDLRNIFAQESILAYLLLLYLFALKTISANSSVVLISLSSLFCTISFAINPESFSSPNKLKIFLKSF